MKVKLLLISGISLYPIFGFAQADSINLEEELKVNDSLNTITRTTDSNTDLNEVKKKEKKTISMVTDSSFLAEKESFDNEVDYVNNLLEEEKKKDEFKELTTFDTEPHGFKFIKEFRTQNDKIYHYVMFDAQMKSKLLNISKLKKNEEIIYKDELLKLEVDGDMRLYSIILSEKIIGSLENFRKVYYTVFDEQALRVTASGTGQHHFFREFAKMYYDGDKEILRGKEFRSINELVYFFNRRLPIQQNQ